MKRKISAAKTYGSVLHNNKKRIYLSADTAVIQPLQTGVLYPGSIDRYTDDGLTAKERFIAKLTEIQRETERILKHYMGAEWEERLKSFSMEYLLTGFVIRKLDFPETSVFYTKDKPIIVPFDSPRPWPSCIPDAQYRDESGAPIVYVYEGQPIPKRPQWMVNMRDRMNEHDIAILADAYKLRKMAMDTIKGASSEYKPNSSYTKQDGEFIFAANVLAIGEMAERLRHVRPHEHHTAKTKKAVSKMTNARRTPEDVKQAALSQYDMLLEQGDMNKTALSKVHKATGVNPRTLRSWVDERKKSL